MEARDEEVRGRGSELACFEANGEVYAVDVMQVGEIVRDVEVTRLPRAPALIEGVIDLRGRVLPVIDLGRALGGPPVARGPRARIVVLEIGDLSLGIRVEAAVDVIAVDPGTLREPPELAVEQGAGAVQSLVQREGASPVMLLSLPQLLESVRRSDAGTGEAAA